MLVSYKPLARLFAREVCFLPPMPPAGNLGLPPCLRVRRPDFASLLQSSPVLFARKGTTPKRRSRRSAPQESARRRAGSPPPQP